jgi:hypothetical protein
VTPIGNEPPYSIDDSDDRSKRVETKPVTPLVDWEADRVWRLTRIATLSVLAVVGIGLCLGCFFVETIVRWVLIAFTMLDVIIWFGIAAGNLLKKARFGNRKTLEEMCDEQDPARMARLLRHHLGWSPGKIAAEMNRREIFNHGAPWNEDDVCRTIKGT